MNKPDIEPLLIVQIIPKNNKIGGMMKMKNTSKIAIRADLASLRTPVKKFFLHPDTISLKL